MFSLYFYPYTILSDPLSFFWLQRVNQNCFQMKEGRIIAVKSTESSKRNFT
jgi:hypothetical protein